MEIVGNRQKVSPDRYRFVIEIVVFVVLASGSVVHIAVTPLLPMLMEEYAISKGVVSWIVSVAPIVTAIAVVPAGILAAKIGVRKTFAMGAFLQAGGIFTPWCTTFGLLVANRCSYALGCAMTIPVSGGIIAEWFDRREMPLVNACNVAAYAVGNIIALFITVPIAMTYSWRIPLTIFGGVSFIAACAWLILGRERRQGTSGMLQVVPFSMVKIRGILQEKTTWLIAGCMFGSHIIVVALNSWLPTYYYTQFNIPLARASSILAIRPIVGIFASLLVGIASMRVGKRRPFLLVIGLLIGFVGAGTFVTDNMAIIFASIALLGICHSSVSPLVYTMTMEHTGAASGTVSVVLAMAQVAGNVASFISPVLVGYLADYSGSYLPGFIICCILSATLFVCAKYLPETGPKANKARAELEKEL